MTNLRPSMTENPCRVKISYAPVNHVLRDAASYRARAVMTAPTRHADQGTRRRHPSDRQVLNAVYGKTGCNRTAQNNPSDRLIKPRQRGTSATTPARAHPTPACHATSCHMRPGSKSRCNVALPTPPPLHPQNGAVWTRNNHPYTKRKKSN